MSSSPLRTAPTRAVLTVGLGALALLTGCSASSGDAQPAAAPSSVASSPAPVAVASPAGVAPSVVAPPSAKAPVEVPVRTPATAPVTASAAAMACPDPATLFARLPAAETAGNRVAHGRATCAGEWAVIGVLHQGGQSVALFSSATGSWRPADAVGACADGELPAALVDGVCNAG